MFARVSAGILTILWNLVCERWALLRLLLELRLRTVSSRLTHALPPARQQGQRLLADSKPMSSASTVHMPSWGNQTPSLCH